MRRPVISPSGIHSLGKRRLSNRYDLPEEEVELERKRDTKCVYCHKKMGKPDPNVWRGDWATIEYLNHLPPWDNPKTIAICCSSCNFGREEKTILEWFKSTFCRERNISPATVAQPVLDDPHTITERWEASQLFSYRFSFLASSAA